MKIINKLFLSIFSFLLFFNLISSAAFAQDKSVNIYFFWGKNCPHCADEKPFLQKLEEKYNNVKVQSFEVTANSKNLKLLQETGKKLNANVAGALVPFTVVGEHYFVGWYNEETTGKAIEEALLCAINEDCPDIVSSIIESKNEESEFQKPNNLPDKLNLPILGDISIKNLSLPAITFLLALIDGFNPCAMWVLLFLISLLLGMKDRKRMWVLGITFIFASGIVYFLFLTAWLNLFLFLGFVFWVRILIGLIALGAGGYNLWDWYQNKDGGCKVVEGKKRKKVFEQIKAVAQKKEFLFAFFGMILLAFAVNLVELICSAGLPAIFTQVLALNKLPNWQYYFYLVFYIIIFMIDDLLVFFVAMTTLRAVGIESKYAKFSKLIGGIVILIIGLLMLFKPEVLMFG
jgi:thiol-disulfide isomerase/thioredoxin